MAAVGRTRGGLPLVKVIVAAIQVLFLIVPGLYCLPVLAIESDGPIHELADEGVIRDWLVVGPFPNPEVADALPDGSRHLGFNTDYLHSLGGEGGAEILPATQVGFKDEDGFSQIAYARRTFANERGEVDLDEAYDHADFKVAYAYCRIDSDRRQTAGFFFGSDDGGKVWINGELVHSIYAGRRLLPREDHFTAELNEGPNTVLVKITDRVWSWGFVLEVLEKDDYDAILAERQGKADLRSFLNCRLVPDVGNAWDYTFLPGDFPEVKWDKPCLVEKVMGTFPLKIRWFDKSMNEVTTGGEPGRYAFVAEGTTPRGLKVRRAATLYCRPQSWIGWSERPKAVLEYMPADCVDKAAWEEHEDAIAGFVGRTMMLSILGQQEGAVLMSYLDEIEATGEEPAATDTPIIRDHDYHLALKRRLLGVEGKYPELEMPRRTVGKTAPVLHAGAPAEAGIVPGTADKIRSVCREWFDVSGEPFDVLVARHGVIIIHEAFGEDERGPFALDTATPLASLTKLITGVMFAQFIDQGLVAIDDPVGRFLPDLPVEGEKAITLRHCFTHTSGLYGHEEWGGLHNPWMENVVANALPLLEPGKVHEYNGMGYDLAGRVMEIVGGKSVFRLMRENFFEPLELRNTTLEEDLAFSCFSTAGDVARIGQLLLNGGSYGDLEFFSRETCEQLLPVDLSGYYPEIDREWGIGITWMRQSHPRAGKDGVPEGTTILGENMYGHGSATSAVLRVDPENDLVIAQTRWRGGREFRTYLGEFMLAIEEGLAD